MNAQQAYRMVRTALAKGELRRPAICPACGRKVAVASDGRALIHAHHYRGYDHPLDIQWLCAECHRKETPLPAVMGAPVYGEHNGQSKLTAVTAEEIRNSALGCRRLARIYGVDKKTIQRVRNGTHWLAAPSEALAKAEAKPQAGEGTD